MPGRRRMRRDGALLAQDGDRADRVDLDHLRRHQSPCIEPIPANIYNHKTLSGSFSVRNPYLEKLLAAKGKDTDEVWNSILEQGQRAAPRLPDRAGEGRVQDRFEIDQRWLLELAADRTPFIDQSQSLNLFIPADVHKWDLHQLHFMAWERGVKSLYYCRSLSIQRADNVSEKAVRAGGVHRGDGACRRMTGRRRCRWWRRAAGECDGL